MIPPNPILLYKAGVHNMSDAAILWHLAQCGIGGATIAELVCATSIGYTTCYPCLARLKELHLALPSIEGRGQRAAHWSLTRLGWRLATHSMESTPTMGPQLEPIAATT
jgi:hypothetical protein